MFRFDDFYRAIGNTSLAPHLPAFQAAVRARYDERIHGDHALWQQAFDRLPDLSAASVELDRAAITARGAEPLDPVRSSRLREALQGLHPWRKGPFDLFGVQVDAEWRSDWKWQRLERHVSPLHRRKVLDVGCGNGYHCWRMAAGGAGLVVGIDPSQKFLFQFNAVRKYLGPQPVYFLPLRSEDLPVDMASFDTAFSMGVLYHRRSPFRHLAELRGALKPGGELVLETLIIEGGEGRVLVPGERYACMRNVWFLPSAAELLNWLHKAGFREPRLVDQSITSTQEQRRTEWMRFHSLADFLDPEDPTRTVEGHPAPRRGLFIAHRPR